MSRKDVLIVKGLPKQINLVLGILNTIYHGAKYMEYKEGSSFIIPDDYFKKDIKWWRVNIASRDKILRDVKYEV